VLADTERLQWRAYDAVLAPLGVTVDAETYGREFIATGLGPEWACRTFGLPLTPDELRERKRPGYRRLLEAGVAPMPGAREAVVRLRVTHRIGLATNTAHDETRLILDQLGLTGLLHAVVAREDYDRPKPAPDAYLAAAARLGLMPAECAVVEDTERGVRAARAAGATVVAVPNELTAGNDFTGSARRLAHLDELTADLLAQL
jgi:HAD superfamily hydrolase (TIGR01509 family)